MPTAKRRKSPSSTKRNKNAPAKLKPSTKDKPSKARSGQKKSISKAVRPQPFPVCGVAFCSTGQNVVYARW